MKILRLSLHNFRNYHEKHFHFSQMAHLIVGENGSGKSSLLEAISLLVCGRSFRTPYLSDLISFGKNYFHIEVHFEKGGEEECLKIYFDEKSKKITHNGTALPHFSSLFGLLIGGVISPHDHDLIQREPALRRRFLDLHLSQADPTYLYHLTRYYKALQQRNALLRQRRVEGIEVWEEEMAKSAAYIVKERRECIKELGELAEPIFASLFGEEGLSLEYLNVAPENGLTEYYQALFARKRERELELKMTLFGPHREDFTIQLQGQEAKYFASEGKRRIAALSLRFSEWKRWKSKLDLNPLLCLDDIFMGLDAVREKRVFSFLSSLEGQLFLTSTKENDTFSFIRLSPRMYATYDNALLK